ncbi:hypothetical protein HGM15179_021051 [Zosterops borbonicus]|uniref:Ig-like domain-containing protein n=1 Tax=Zosterops borbonicus TaxID=364589 RepID=A0A8K1D7K2_9PASS|nr:hypothetical protein HGM15179_021051 [Zosterops borbonicus]
MWSALCVGFLPIVGGRELKFLFRALFHQVRHDDLNISTDGEQHRRFTKDIPKTSVPQVIVMKSKKLEEGGSSGKAACLARNFLTKNISLEMPSEEVVYKQSTSILTSEGLYNAIKVVKVTKGTEVTCTAKFDNSTITTEPEKVAEEPVTGASARVCNSTDASAQAVSLAGAASLGQPRGLTVQEGDAVTFECIMRGNDMRRYSISWYRQGPSGTLEWIYYEDGTYGQGFQDRFKIRNLKDRNRFPLQILAAKPEDAATYYCRARITPEQLCSRVNQKPTDGEDRSLSTSF